MLELGAIVAGPFCGRLLADLGTEVIKVEPAEMTAGFDTVACTPEQLGAFSRAEPTKRAQVAKEAGVRVK